MQVMITASVLASKYNDALLAGVQAAQSKEMLKLQKDAEHRKEQVVDPENKSEASAIAEKKENSRQWKKGSFDQKSDRDEAELTAQADDTKKAASENHIIDIKA
jgi:hypothetical protein